VGKYCGGEKILSPPWFQHSGGERPRHPRRSDASVPPPKSCHQRGLTKAQVCCDVLLSAHSSDFVKCTIVTVSHDIFWQHTVYDEARRICNTLSLAERRHELGKRFFQRIINDKSNVLFYLLPAKRDVQLTTRLRCARQHPTIYARTNRYKNSFILFAVNHFQ